MWVGGRLLSQVSYRDEYLLQFSKPLKSIANIAHINITSTQPWPEKGDACTFLGKESFDVASLFSSNVISRYTVTNTLHQNKKRVVLNDQNHVNLITCKTKQQYLNRSEKSLLLLDQNAGELPYLLSRAVDHKSWNDKHDSTPCKGTCYAHQLIHRHVWMLPIHALKC